MSGCRRRFLSRQQQHPSHAGSGPPPHLWERGDPRLQRGLRCGKQTRFLQGKSTDVSGRRQQCKRKKIAKPLPSWAVPVGHGGWGSPRRPAERPGPAPTLRLTHQSLLRGRGPRRHHDLGNLIAASSLMRTPHRVPAPAASTGLPQELIPPRYRLSPAPGSPSCLLRPAWTRYFKA